MPRDQSEGFVLRTLPIGDQDKIVVFFSSQKGIVRGVAKGARKFGNRFGSSLEPLSLAKIYYYEKENRELVTISGCDLLESFFDVQANIEAAYTLSYFAEIIEEFLPCLSGDNVLFRLLLSTLRALKAGGPLDFNAAYFEAWFLKINGLLPDLRNCRSCGQAIQGQSFLSSRKDGVFCRHCQSESGEQVKAEFLSFLAWVKKNPPSDNSLPPFSAEDMRGFRKILQSIIIYHMEREPKSLRYIPEKKT